MTREQANRALPAASYQLASTLTDERGQPDAISVAVALSLAVVAAAADVLPPEDADRLREGFLARVQRAAHAR